MIVTASLISVSIAQPQTFAQAVRKLTSVHDPVVLKQVSSRAIVLAEFQGRVMVISANGEQGSTLDWANFEYLAGPNTDNNSVTGGASRL